MNILVLTVLESQCASLLLRLGFFLQELKNRKQIKNYYINLIEKYDQSDIVIIQRFIPLQKELFLKFDNNPKPIIFETDDLLLKVSSYYSIESRYRRAEVNAFWSLLKHYISGITVSTDYLKKEFLQYSVDTEVVYNALPLKYENIPSHRNDSFKIGFFGTPTHERDFQFLLQSLKALKNEFNDQLEYYFFGFIPKGFQQWQKGVYFYPYNNQYLNALEKTKSIGLHLALAPLTNSSFNRAKSVIKYLEYTYFGAIGLYSNVLSYKGIRGGFVLPNKAASWEIAMRNLMDDSSLRNSFYNQAITDISKKYDFETELHKFYGFLQKMIHKKRDTSKNNILNYRNKILDRFAKMDEYSSYAYVNLFNEVYPEEFRKVKDSFIEKLLAIKPSGIYSRFIVFKLLLKIVPYNLITPNGQKLVKFFINPLNIQKYPNLFIEFLKLIQSYDKEKTWTLIGKSEFVLNDTRYLFDVFIIKLKMLNLDNDFKSCLIHLQDFLKKFHTSAKIISKIEYQDRMVILLIHLVNILKNLNNVKWEKIYKTVIRLIEKKETKNDSDIYRLASLYKMKKYYDKAILFFEQAISISSNPELIGGAHFHLGCIHQSLGNKEKARQHFEECLKFIPEHKKAKRYLELAAND